MAIRLGPVTVDTKTVAVAGVPEALTGDDVTCTQVFIIANEDNSGVNVYIVDSNDSTKKVVVPAVGITLPVSNPKRIQVDVDVSTDKLDWGAS